MKICRKCGQEKNRAMKNNRPFFYCHCAAWKSVMAFLELARSRPRRKEA